MARFILCMQYMYISTCLDVNTTSYSARDMTLVLPEAICALMSDLILANNINMISELNAGRDLSGSDHKDIRLNFDWAVTHEANTILVPNFRKGDYEGFIRHLEEVNWGTFGLDEGNISGLKPEGQRNHVEMTYNNSVRVMAKSETAYS